MTTELAITTTTNPAQPALAYLARLRTSVSRLTMTTELRRVAEMLGVLTPDPNHPARMIGDWQSVPWAALDAAKVRALYNQVKGADATRNKTLSALKGVASAAYEAGEMSEDTYRRITLIKSTRAQSDDATLAGRMIEDWELAALMRACAKDASASGARDAAMIALAAKTGARRAEIAGVMLNAITPTSEGYETKIVGKRGKVRVLYADNGASKALAEWLAIRGAQLGDDAPLFVNISQRGEIGNHQITTTSLDKILRKRCTQANVSDCDWHDFRRTFAGKLLDNGEDISTAAQLMGHSSVTTTARYDRRPAEARRRAARKVSVPYFKWTGTK